jgi:hypothetical protein
MGIRNRSFCRNFSWLNGQNFPLVDTWDIYSSISIMMLTHSLPRYNKKNKNKIVDLYYQAYLHLSTACKP